jgi:heme exporter protein A
MAQAIVEAHGLGKNFGATPVLRAIDLGIEAGRGAAVSGINGAGKSTLLKLLAGLSAPSFGQAMLFGEESLRLPAEKRRRVGVMTHQSFLYPNLTARENLEFYASLYQVESPTGAARRWLERVGLTSAVDERVSAFSRGMEQRLSAARAMLADPDALLMDEPFAGLDSQGVSMVADLIKEAMARGCAVLVTAHDTPALEKIELKRLELSAGRLMAVRNDGRPGRLLSASGA